MDLEWQINQLEVIFKSWDEVGFELMTSGLIINFLPLGSPFKGNIGNGFSFGRPA